MTRRRAATLVGGIVAFFLVLVAIGAVGVGPTPSNRGGALGAPEPAGTSTTRAPRRATTTTVPITRGPQGNGRPVTIAFGGDSHFEAHVGARLRAEGAAMLAPLEALFAGSDLQVLNLETAITERGAPQPKKWTFRAPTSALDALAGAGVDAVSMANNHGLDFGPQGLEDSLAARANAPLAVIGAGVDASDAYRPFTTTIRGQRISVIAASQVLDEELIYSWSASDTDTGVAARPGLASAKNVSRLTSEVAKARAVSDTVVVFLHWGLERNDCPTRIQEGLVPALQEAGADIVVGSHAHRLLGGGMKGETFVGYGLGNFIWFNESGANGATGALLVTATGRHIDRYEWRPARIRNGVPTVLEGAAAADAQARWQALRACTDLSP